MGDMESVRGVRKRSESNENSVYSCIKFSKSNGSCESLIGKKLTYFGSVSGPLIFSLCVHNFKKVETLTTFRVLFLLLVSHSIARLFTCLSNGC